MNNLFDEEFTSYDFQGRELQHMVTFDGVLTY